MNAETSDKKREITFNELEGKVVSQEIWGSLVRVKILESLSARQNGLLGVHGLEPDQLVIFKWREMRFPSAQRFAPRSTMSPEMKMDIVAGFLDSQGCFVAQSGILRPAGKGSAPNIYNCPYPTRWMFEIPTNSNLLGKVLDPNSIGKTFLSQKFIEDNLVLTSV